MLGKRSLWRQSYLIEKIRLYSRHRLYEGRKDDAKLMTNFWFLVQSLHEDQIYFLILISIGGGGVVAKSCPTLASPWTGEPGSLQSLGFSRQEYWSGLPFPSLGDLPNPGIKPGSPALWVDSLPTELQGKLISTR